MLGNASNMKIMIIAFIMAIVSGPVIIPALEKLGIGQSIREEGPQSHKSKSGTPTMGGLIIIGAALITIFAFGMDNFNTDLILVIFATLAFGLIGFIDDYIIVVRKDNKGLNAKQKLIGQIIFALIIAIIQAKYSSLGTKLIIPFVKYKYLDLGILYIPFTAFVLVAIVNAVNLTDGLDGLASGVTMIVLTFFASVATAWKVDNISYIASALAGACLGFLVFNSHPAKIFMGDTGSMALGGAVGAIAVVLNMTLFIPIVGGIYFAEALSVIIQVISFKTRGKRVFLMAPLHHHYEAKGWKETKVVKVFWAITLVLCLIGFIAI